MAANNNGRKTAADLSNACNISVEEATSCIQQYDEDGDGTLDEEEFENLREQILSQQQQEMTNAINSMDTHQNFDADGDGKLSAAELAEACNISIEDAQNIIQQYDADGDGQLDPEEFENLKQQVLEQQRQNMTNKLSHNQFHADMDNDGDGKLSAVELANACNISQQEAENIIMQYDVDGDGQLDAEEFEELKQQVLQQQRQMMTEKLSANDTHQAMDDDGDGKLSAKELAEACNITQTEAENIIQQYDVDGDGQLDAEEFEQLKQQILQQQRAKVSDALTSHQQMDDNKDGKVSAYELSQACNITMKEAELLIQQNDTDGDGMLDQQEFENLKNKILKDQEEKKRAQQLQQQRQQRQKEQQQQFNENNNDAQKFSHKWKLGMNFDPKNEQIVLYITDEITQKNWGITLTKQNFANGANIRQEYRKLGESVSGGKIDYDYNDNGGPLGVTITKENNRYNYSCPQQ